ncbi:hypothetical protein DIE07_10320 [Burkholderia sp. Bp9002]|nr:hypothetical protein DIE18_06615 [Burkholderia sp. Bp9125]RQS12079.1 hypothetical protein DIE07_10320 [Burkholderia sp. Bp9002]
MRDITEDQARRIRGGASLYSNSADYTVNMVNQSIGSTVQGLMNQYQARVTEQFRMSLGSSR